MASVIQMPERKPTVLDRMMGGAQNVFTAMAERIQEERKERMIKTNFEVYLENLKQLDPELFDVSARIYPGEMESSSLMVSPAKQRITKKEPSWGQEQKRQNQLVLVQQWLRGQTIIDPQNKAKDLVAPTSREQAYYLLPQHFPLVNREEVKDLIMQIELEKPERSWTGREKKRRTIPLPGKWGEKRAKQKLSVTQQPEKTAINPKTGEKLVLRNGKWQKLR